MKENFKIITNMGKEYKHYLQEFIEVDMLIINLKGKEYFNLNKEIIIKDSLEQE